MSSRRIIALGILLFLAPALAGCHTVPGEHKGAAVGAAAGGAAGAIIGGSSTRGAVIGGLLGALIGGAIGHYAYDRQKSRQETVASYNYRSKQGTVLTIESAEARPAALTAGKTVNLPITYVVLTPSPEERVTITEVRQITLNGNLVGRPQVSVDRRGGTYRSNIPVRLPSDAEPGRYQVTATVATQRAEDTRVFTFTVE